jgi:hypothetical protein
MNSSRKQYTLLFIAESEVLYYTKNNIFQKYATVIKVKKTENKDLIIK